MKQKIIATLIQLLTYPAFAQQSILECISKDVFDAGFYVKVTQTPDTYLGEIQSISGWGSNTTLFKGAVTVQADPLSQLNLGKCKIEIKETTGQTAIIGRSVHLRLIENGSDELLELNGDVTSDIFTKLKCTMSSDVVQTLCD